VSEPTDINDNDPTDDKNLSALYDRASTEQPSKSVDAAITAKAKHYLGKTPRTSSYLPEWKQTFSIAAVLVLSVTVVLMIDSESPEIFEDSAPVVIEQKAVMEKKVTEKETLKQEIKTTGKLKQHKLDESPARPQEKRQPKKSGFMDNMTSSLTPSSKTVTGINEIVMNKAVPEKAKARKKLGAPAMEADAEVAKFARSVQAPRTMMGIVADSTDEDSAVGLSCQQLAEKECLTSAACTLKKVIDTTSYQCLPANNHCELMFRQSEGTKESCETKQGCEFVPSQCYCHPDVKCVCGGGEPPQCRSETQTE
jgi:hypothetical protein